MQGAQNIEKILLLPKSYQCYW